MPRARLLLLWMRTETASAGGSSDRTMWSIRLATALAITIAAADAAESQTIACSQSEVHPENTRASTSRGRPRAEIVEVPGLSVKSNDVTFFERRGDRVARRFNYEGLVLSPENLRIIHELSNGDVIAINVEASDLDSIDLFVISFSRAEYGVATAIIDANWLTIISATADCVKAD